MDSYYDAQRNWCCIKYLGIPTLFLADLVRSGGVSCLQLFFFSDPHHDKREQAESRQATQVQVQQNPGQSLAIIVADWGGGLSGAAHPEAIISSVA